MALPVPTRPRTGRLSRSERDIAIERIKLEMIERGETRLKNLAALVGVTPRRIDKLVAEARKRIAIETDEPPAAARTKLANRFDVLYRQALESFEFCKSKGDLKTASEFQRNAIAVVGQHAKVLGVESLPPAAGQQPNVRIIYEGFHEAPAAAKAAAARILQAASGSSALPQLTGEVSDSGVRSSVGQGLRNDDGVATPGDVPGDGARE